MPVLNNADALYFGTETVSAVYSGTTRVWPASWSPASLSGLSIWLDATISGDLTIGWADQSGLGHYPLTVGSPAPTVRANALNGLPVVRFKANEGRLRATGTDVTYAHTLVYVSRMVGPNAGRVVCAAYPPPNFLTGWWNGYMDVAYSTTGSFFTPDTRKAWNAEGVPSPWIMYSGDADNPPNYRPRMFRNGVLLSGGGSDGSVSSGDSFRNTFNISGYSPDDASETADCEVAEVVLYSRKLSDADRQLVEGYLRTKWGL